MDRDREEENNWRVFRTLLSFTLMMITLPVTLYFFSKSFIFEAVFGMESRMAYMYSAGVAVLVVHIILGMFIYVAYKEGGMSRTPVTFKED